jgi:hypothetical protein
MMTDSAADRRAKNSMMACHVPGYASHGGPRQATGFSACRKTQSEAYPENGQMSFHCSSLML